MYDEDSLADQDIANTRDGSETTSEASIRSMLSQVVARRVVINDVADMTSGDQCATMTKEANNRANADFRVFDMKDALTVAFRSAKQLVIAKGVDPDLTTISSISPVSC